MEVIKLTFNDKYWDQAISYTKSCSWGTEIGNHLAELLENNRFNGWEAFFVALEIEKIIGFCTFLKEDYYPENRYSPWISSIFADEKYRGNKLSGEMIESVIKHAKIQGFSKVYIPSDMKGFYEKYGFTPIDTLVNYNGDYDTVFMKKI